MAKNKTVKSQRNKWRRIEYACFIGEFVAIATPFVAIAIANYDKYFVEYNGTKMSTAFFMGLAVMGLAIFLITKKKLENSYITLVVGWAVCAFIFTMMGEMITDLAYMMWFGLLGLGSAWGLDIASQKAKKKKESINEAISQAQKEDMVQQYKNEEKKVKLKIRIKK